MPKNAVFPKVFHQPLAFSYVETVMDMQKLSFEELKSHVFSVFSHVGQISNGQSPA
jgi:hypothetical protein